MTDILLRPDNLITMFKKLKFLLAYADKIYATYNVDEKKFVYAKALYKVNTQINFVLEDNVHAFPDKCLDDIIDLLLHIEIWCIIWKTEVLKQSPNWNSEFFFVSEVRFPRLQVNRLINMIEKVH